MTHLQYVAWPDHGVPDDSSDFLEFVNYVRSLRVDGEPVLVHCRYCGFQVYFGLVFKYAYSIGKDLRKLGRDHPKSHETLCFYEKALLISSSLFQKIGNFMKA